MNGKKTVLSLALGSAFAVTLVAAPLATATENPFGMSALKSGYLLAAADEAKPAAKPAPKPPTPPVIVNPTRLVVMSSP